MSDAIGELERKVNPRRAVSEHPLASVAITFAIGVVLGTRRASQAPANVASTGTQAPGVVHTLVDRVATALASAATARIFHGTGTHGVGASDRISRGERSGPTPNAQF
ncbi:MAG: hypothetical protein ABJD07_11485 [Gemmatimonadaceae bacterium]